VPPLQTLITSVQACLAFQMATLSDSAFLETVPDMATLALLGTPLSNILTLLSATLSDISANPCCLTEALSNALTCLFATLGSSAFQTALATGLLDLLSVAPGPPTSTLLVSIVQNALCTVSSLGSGIVGVLPISVTVAPPNCSCSIPSDIIALLGAMTAFISQVVSTVNTIAPFVPGSFFGATKALGVLSGVLEALSLNPSCTCKLSLAQLDSLVAAVTVAFNVLLAPIGIPIGAQTIINALNTLLVSLRGCLLGTVAV